MTTDTDDKQALTSFTTDELPQETSGHLQKIECFERQSLWLDAYRFDGTIAAACRATGVSRQRVYDWRAMDQFGFTERFESARVQFAESIENLALDRIRDPQGNRGSDMLVMAMLNANMPDKYKRNTGGLEENTGRELLSELKSLRALATRNVPAQATGGDAASIQVTKALEAKGVKDG